MILLRESAQGVSFAVRIQTRSSRTGIRGILGAGEEASLKVAVASPPMDGRANQELLDYFSGFFGVPGFAVDVISGMQSRNKVVRVQGKGRFELEQKILAALEVCV